MFKRLLFAIGIAPLACLLLTIPLIGLISAGGAALFGAAILGFLICVQTPFFLLIRKRFDCGKPEA
jgi:hypothetical protein